MSNRLRKGITLGIVYLLTAIVLLSGVKVWGQEDRPASDRLEQADALQNQALQALIKRELDKSEDLYLQAANLYTQEETWEKAAFSYIIASVAAYSNRQIDGMKIHLSAAKKIADSSLSPEQNTDIFQRLYWNFGLYYDACGDYDQAITATHKSLSAERGAASPDSSTLASSYGNLGVLYERKGDHQQALNNYERGLTICLDMKVPDYREIARILTGIGVIYYNKGNASSALSYALRGLAFLNRIPDPSITEFERYILLYNSLAINYMNMEQRDSAYHYLNEARLLHEKKNIRTYREVTFHNLGLFFNKTKEDKKAIAHFLQAIEIAKEGYTGENPWLAKPLKVIGSMYIRDGQFAKGLSYYQQALIALSRQYSDTSYLSNPSIDQIDAYLEVIKVLDAKGLALLELNRIHPEDTTLLRAAMDVYTMAVPLLDTLHKQYASEESRQFLAEESHRLYENGIESAYRLYMHTGDKTYIEQAFYMSEKSKAVILLDVVQAAEARLYAGVPDSLIRYEQRLKRDVMFYTEKLRKVRADVDSAKILLYQGYLFRKRDSVYQLSRVFARRYPAYFALRYKTDVADASAIREKLLQDNSVFLEYFAGRKNIYLFSIGTSTLQFYRLSDVKPIYKGIDSLKISLSDYTYLVKNPSEGYQKYTHYAFDLYKQLVAPALTSLSAVPERLIIVPDGALGQIPFEAFLDAAGPADALNYQSLSYLLRKYRIQYGYSGTLLMKHLNPPRRKLRRECLAFAPFSLQEDIELPGGEINQRALFRAKPENLPYAPKEVDRIASMFHGTFFFDQSATKSNFLQEAENYRMIHLAMHGILNIDDPLRSYLAFFRADGESLESSSLYAYELAGLALEADLVVLSACETGVGKFYKGEGIMSLARGFMYAGAASVVMSLWKMEDQASSDIMADFYSGLASELPKDQALNEAKKHYLSVADNLEAHPFYWAGFVQFGNNRPIQKVDFFKWLWISLAAGIGIFAYQVRRRWSRDRN